jgi:hypothetical protein
MRVFFVTKAPTPFEQSIFPEIWPTLINKANKRHVVVRMLTKQQASFEPSFLARTIHEESTASAYMAAQAGVLTPQALNVLRSTPPALVATFAHSHHHFTLSQQPLVNSPD